jgi:hypothetical protein
MEYDKIISALRAELIIAEGNFRKYRADMQNSTILQLYEITGDCLQKMDEKVVGTAITPSSSSKVGGSTKPITKGLQGKGYYYYYCLFLLLFVCLFLFYCCGSDSSCFCYIYFV